MKESNNRKLLLPKTLFGKLSVLYFCLVWWLMNNQPVLQFFNDMVQGEEIVWLLGMPINFTYIIGTAIFTAIWIVVLLLKWEVGDDE